MRRTRSAPVLWTINGIGLRFSGERDHDHETNSHVATRVLTFVFIPILALSAWRIIPAGGSRYHLLGQEPLSDFAKRANILVLCLALVFGSMTWWEVHTHSPEYLGNEAMERANKSLEDEKPAEALREYTKIINATWPQAPDAKKQLPVAFDAGLRSGTAADRINVVNLAREAAIGPHHLLKDAASRVMAWAKLSKDDAITAEVMKATLPSVPQTEREAFEKQRLVILEKITKAAPDNMNAAIDLAFIYDENDRGSECRQLLEPHAAKLGATEGARILGRILVHEGKHKEGGELLRAYSKDRLPAYHRAETGLQTLYKTLSTAALDDLNHNRASTSFYNNYRKASETQKEQLVDEYITGVVKKSPRWAAAQEKLSEAGTIVPVMLDLGIATLRLAQEQPDADARKQGLEEAEKAFLSIGRSAGETDEYRLFLGQVYYWMGKADEGKALFAKLADSNDGSDDLTGLAVMVAESLRQVGAVDDARSQAELAYTKAKNSGARYGAARERALVWRDTDDRILWLGRCDASQPDIHNELFETKAHKRIQDGQSKEAVPLLRQALEGYDKMVRSAATLNNSANVLSMLYDITHDPADARESLNRYEESVRLNPDDTVGLNNLCSGLIRRISLDLVSAQADLKNLPAGIEGLLVSNLRRNAADSEQQVAQIRDSEPARKAREILEKLIVLAPKQPDHCRSLQELYMTCRRLPELKKLVDHVKAGNFDFTSEWAEAKKAWTEPRDKEMLANIDSEIKNVQAAISSQPATVSKDVMAALKANLLEHQVGRTLVASSLTAAEFTSAAEALLKLHEGSGGQAVAEAALMCAATMEASADPALAAFAKKYRRWLGDSRLLALALDKGIGTAAIKASPALKRWGEIRIKAGAAWPADRNLAEWALLRHILPDEAKTCQSAVLADERLLTDVGLDRILSPMNIGTVLQTLFLGQMQGDTSIGEADYRAALKQGMPLPER